MDLLEQENEIKRAKKNGKVDSLKGTFLVYMAKQCDEIIYIGSGLHGREQHCVSGCSNVYGLNERHFNGDEIKVSIVKRFSSKTESLEHEKQLICLHRPILIIKCLFFNISKGRKGFPSTH